MAIKLATWADILRYADHNGLPGQDWTANGRKVPNRWRATIASAAIGEDKHCPDEFFTVFKSRRVQVAPLKP